MSNHHYVSQKFFKRFNNGVSSIALLRMLNGQIVSHAKINKQCKRANYHGSQPAEKKVTELENEFDRVIDNVLSLLWNSIDVSNITKKGTYHQLIHFILFQKYRNINHLKFVQYYKNNWVVKDLIEKAILEGNAPLLAAIANGNFKIKHNNRIKDVLFNLEQAWNNIGLIQDLDFLLLKNRTSRPFLFSDCPVALHNTYLETELDKNVIELNNMGLQIFLPLDARTAILLNDFSLYTVPTAKPNDYNMLRVVELDKEDDVRQINLLQLHNSVDNVYFGDISHSSYVETLWKDCHKNVLPLDARWTADYERQANIQLRLSFINVNIPWLPGLPRHRLPQVVKSINPQLFQEPTIRVTIKDNQ